MKYFSAFTGVGGFDMGLPDDWTRYGIDAEGNTVEISDTQRYNLTGNGVVPQVVSSITV